MLLNHFEPTNVPSMSKYRILRTFVYLFRFIASFKYMLRTLPKSNLCSNNGKNRKYFERYILGFGLEWQWISKKQKKNTYNMYFAREYSFAFAPPRLGEEPKQPQALARYISICWNDNKEEDLSKAKPKPKSYK